MARCLLLGAELPGCGAQVGRKSLRYRHSLLLKMLPLLLGLMPVIKVAIVIAWLLGSFVAILKLLDLKAYCFDLS